MSSLLPRGRNFANKLYNACRFRQMANSADLPSETVEMPSDGLRPYHVDIAGKLDQLALNLNKSYADYRFNDVGQQLYDFLWSEFCDKFLEAVKGDLRDSASAEAREMTLSVFDAVMSRYLQLLHPYMPHITEELSIRMSYVDEGEFVMQKVYPEAALVSGDHVSESSSQAEAIYAAAGRMRNLKAEYNMATRKDVKFYHHQIQTMAC